jgi:hypothetical protein
MPSGHSSSNQEQQNERMSEAEKAQGDALRKQLERAEKLLAEIRDGKHSIQGVLVHVERYFADRPGRPEQP